LGKRRYQRKIDSLAERIVEHEAKIRREREKDRPDEGLIAHWEREIRVFREAMQKAQKRLGEKG
jgi:hypothetical protein